MTLMNQKMIRRISLLTVIMFVLSTFGAYAQTSQVSIPVSANQPVDISILNNVIPELNSLQSNLRSAQSTLSSLERISTPIYSKIAPTGMETMSIAQRVKAILANAKSVLGTTLKTSGEQAKASIAAGASPTTLSYDQQLAYGVEQLGAQAAKIETNGKYAGALDKLKVILASVKNSLQKVVTAIRAKIFAVGQKVGLIDKSKSFEEGKVVDNSEGENGKMMLSASADVQYADSFSGKLSKGVNEGSQAAKTSLKNSFSFSNLAITTAVAVGTNLAIDVIHGNKPSFKQAVKSVASLEFAGNVMGSALGAAGGQFTASIVKSFIPGPIGALVGSVIPVLFASASGQMGSNLITGLKSGEFSVAKAFKQIDKADLIGSSIGSTIGMALGAPIPVIGPIIGGIVGGFLGSKVAKWVSAFAKGGKVSLFGKGANVANNTSTSSGNFSNFSNAIGSLGGSNKSTGPVVAGDSTVGVAQLSVSGSSEKLAEVEKKYYNTYLQYNKMVEANDTEGAKAVFEQLKQYSDEYTTLKKSVQAE
ncbi:MAG TPA: hypothetical protein PLM07_16945 [Candidatus Rifleibacterium sp.]|nr:hypothetical protein [Candidatus Rifleibacterium sp.]HPT47573.1 hypothetical protein [Candidatus Rifleibacterium sp.]